MKSKKNSMELVKLPIENWNSLSSDLQKLCAPGHQVEVSEFMYEDLTSTSYLVIAKIPCPIKDKFMKKTEARLILVPEGGESSLASLMSIPAHYFKESRATGYLVVQNFYLRAGCLGTKVPVLVEVQKKHDGNGREAWVINYYEVDTTKTTGEIPLFEIKIGTPSLPFNPIELINTKNSKFITIVSLNKAIDSKKLLN